MSTNIIRDSNVCKSAFIVKKYCKEVRDKKRLKIKIHCCNFY